MGVTQASGRGPVNACTWCWTDSGATPETSRPRYTRDAGFTNAPAIATSAMPAIQDVRLRLCMVQATAWNLVFLLAMAFGAALFAASLPLIENQPILNLLI